MEFNLVLSDLIELDKLIKFTHKSKSFFGLINLRDNHATATDGYILRTTRLSCQVNELGRKLNLVADATLKNALKMLITQFKKSPEQAVTLSINGKIASIGAIDMFYTVNCSDEEFPECQQIIDIASEPYHGFFQVNLKALKTVIDSMNESTAYFIIPEKDSDKVIVRDRTGSICFVGVN